MTDEPTTDAGTMPDTLPAIPLNWPEAGPRPHPFASVFRMLSGEEKQALDADIAAHELRETIKMYEGMILDGRNRYLGLVDNGAFDPEEDDWEDWPDLFEVFEGTREEALDYVWSLNEQRRHDNATQRAAAAARFANLRTVTLAEAAEKFGVSPRQVSSAQRVIADGAPELVEAMDAGRVPAYLAEKATDLDPDDQREIAAAPKGAASALAREKLQDPPPLSSSGPVVEPTKPHMLTMFAAAVIEVGKAGKSIDPATLDALAREHGLLADADGVLNLSRHALLAFELARKKLSLDDGDLVGRSLYAVLTAGLPDDVEALKGDYRSNLAAFDTSLSRGAHDRAADYKLMMDAIVWHANGKSHGGSVVNERPLAVRNCAAIAPGVVPMWGQNGTFEIEVDGLPAIVVFKHDDFGFGPSFTFQPTRFDLPFPRGGWIEERVRYSEVEGYLDDFTRKLFTRIVERHTEGKKSYPDETVGMFYPEEVFRIGEGRDLDRFSRGVELVDGQWPELPAGVAPMGQNVWPANEKECKERVAEWRGLYGRRKAGFPKTVHLATHVLQIGIPAHIRPLADFPNTGPYVFENNGRWRYVDDGADPGADAVTARLTGGPNDQDRSAAYIGALATIASVKGKHTMASAEDVLRAGVAANVPRQQMADDLGHPIGTIQGWTHKLKLTDPARLREPDPALAARNKARATDAGQAVTE